MLETRPVLLSDGIANYVFLPLSQILKQPAQHPARIVELLVGCLRILIDHGWAKLSPNHARQLLLLLVFFLDPSPPSHASPIATVQTGGQPEELQVELFKTLTSLFRAINRASTAAHSPIIDQALRPSLGHCIVLLLDVITLNSFYFVQLFALEALEAIFAAVGQHEILASFFPGIVSSLAKVLSPPLARSQKFKILERSLIILETIIIRVVGDIHIRHISTNNGNQNEPSILDAAWLENTTSQLKRALTGILKLRSHPSEDVQVALCHLCLALLDECHGSLTSCSIMLVETAMILSDIPDVLQPSMEQICLASTTIQDLALIHSDLAEDIKTVMYSWISSTPRLMDLSDDDARQQTIQRLFSGAKLLQKLQQNSPTLEEAFATALRDAVSAMLKASWPRGITDETPLATDPWKSMSSDVAASSPWAREFPPFVLAECGYRKTRSALTTLLQDPSQQVNSQELLSRMIFLLQDSSNEDQVSAYWLTLQLLKSTSNSKESTSVDEFLDLDLMEQNSGTTASSEVLYELFKYSVDLLNRASASSLGFIPLSDNGDGKPISRSVSAIALETIAYMSTQMGENFRPELMDILYPIASFLGSTNSQLRDHAIIALNIVASSCGYAGVADMIVDNVDYMVNSVSLRLNSLDITPSTPQVLRMMVRLAGPRLVPFLEDIVDAIFAALENYHGYPRLVDGFFAVLCEVAEQGAQTDKRALISDPAKQIQQSVELEKKKWINIEEIQHILEKREKRRKKSVLDAINSNAHSEHFAQVAGHPNHPWKELEGLSDTKKKEPGNEEKEWGSYENHNSIDQETPSPMPSYKILQRITRLSQYFLTSPSPTLRRSLLGLIASVSPSLSVDPDHFLPLLNDLWPVVLERLWDREPFVSTAACDTLAILCETARDFLGTRLHSAWTDNDSNSCDNLYSFMIQAKQCLPELKRGFKIKGTWRPKYPSVESLTSFSIETTKPVKSYFSKLGKMDMAVARKETFSQPFRRWNAARRLLLAMVDYVSSIPEPMVDQIFWLLADELMAAEETVDDNNNKAKIEIKDNAVSLKRGGRSKLDALGVVHNAQETRRCLERKNLDMVWLIQYHYGNKLLPSQPPSFTPTEPTFAN